MFKALKEAYKLLEKNLNEYINKFYKEDKRKGNLTKVINNLEILKKLFSSQGWNLKILNDFEKFLNDTLACERIDNLTRNRITLFLENIKNTFEG